MHCWKRKLVMLNTETTHMEGRKELTESEIRDNVPTTTTTQLHPAFMVGLGGFFLLHVMTLGSLPPVLRGKGAPYLPSLSKKLDLMFTLVRKDAHVIQKLTNGKALRFVDLGSGDGRVVFRAAREGIFQMCVGYEINPCTCFCVCRSRFVCVFCCVTCA